MSRRVREALKKQAQTGYGNFSVLLEVPLTQPQTPSV